MFASVRLYAAIGGAVVIAGLGLLHLATRRKKSHADYERERREFLDRGGRIIDGTVIDVAELNPDEPNAQQLLIYNYDVAGVQYEASQDVTRLRQFIDLYSCRLGLPASMKYDPHNPGDSIVISESWSGLRKPTIVLPRRPLEKSETLV